MMADQAGFFHEELSDIIYAQETDHPQPVVNADPYPASKAAPYHEKRDPHQISFAAPISVSPMNGTGQLVNSNGEVSNTSTYVNPPHHQTVAPLHGAAFVWSLQAAFKNPTTGLLVKGSYEELYNTYPHLGPEIVAAVNEVLGVQMPMHGNQELPPPYEEVFDEFITTDDGQQDHGTAQESPDESSATSGAVQDEVDGYRSQSMSPFDDNEMFPDNQPLDEVTTSASTASSVPHTGFNTPSAAMNHQALNPTNVPLGSGMPSQSSEGSTLSTSQSPATPSSSGSQASSKPAPQYVADIGSLTEALQDLHCDYPEHCTVLSILGDDFHTVKNQAHYFARQLFDAIYLPGGIVPGLDTQERKQKYARQQKTNVAKITKEMADPGKHKKVQAACLLAFKVAMDLHNPAIGVPTTVYEVAKKWAKAEESDDEMKSVRRPTLDLCTAGARLAKMIKYVGKVKSVAHDVLNAKELQKFAFDPKMYAMMKVIYLKSNGTRQLRTTKLSKIAAKKGKTATKKGKTTTKKGKSVEIENVQEEQEEEQKEEEEDEDEEEEEDEIVQPAAKRVKRKA